MLPLAYAYPQAMRATRDLLAPSDATDAHARPRPWPTSRTPSASTTCRRWPRSSASPPTAQGVAERFPDDSVRRMVEVDLALIDHLDEQLQAVELYLVRHAKVDDPQTYQLLQTIPGIGKILALVLLYEIHDIRRFADVRQLRLVLPAGAAAAHESAGKKTRRARARRSATPTSSGPSPRRPA